MEIFFWLCFIIHTVVVLYSIRHSRYITICNAIYCGSTINFVLYLCDWSGDFKLPCTDVTYYLMAIVSFIFSLYGIIELCKKNGKNEQIIGICFKKIKILGVRFCLSNFLVWICLFLYILENIYLTGSVYTSDKITYHTLNMPVIGPLVRGLCPIVYCVACVDWKNYKNRSIIINCLVLMLYALLGLGSRFWTAISLVTMVVFFDKNNMSKIKNKDVKFKIYILLIAIVIYNLFMYLGLERTNALNTMSIWINYQGPFIGTVLEEPLAWYYAYFPYSFYNLNCTLSNIDTNQIIYYGKFILYPFISFFHLYYFIDIDIVQMTRDCRVIYNTAATVPTGWYEYYADLGYLFFLELLIMVYITYYFYRKNSFFGYASYSTMFTIWIFYGFNNIFLHGVQIYSFLIAYIINKYMLTSNNR